MLTHAAVGIKGQVANCAHRQVAGCAVLLEWHQQLRRKRAVQAAPGSAARQPQFGRQVFERWLHQVGGAHLGFTQHEGVIAGHIRLGNQRVGVKRAKPGGQAGAEFGQSHEFFLQRAHLGLRGSVARIGRDEAVDVAADCACLLEQLIQPPDHGFKCVDCGAADLRPIAPIDAALFE